MDKIQLASILGVGLMAGSQQHRRPYIEPKETLEHKKLREKRAKKRKQKKRSRK